MGTTVSIYENLNDLNHAMSDFNNRNTDDIHDFLKEIETKMMIDEIHTVPEFNKSRINWLNLLESLKLNSPQIHVISIRILYILCIDSFKLVKHEESFVYFDIHNENSLLLEVAHTLSYQALSADIFIQNYALQSMLILINKKEFTYELLKGGIMNSLIIIIQDPNIKSSDDFKATQMHLLALKIIEKAVSYRINEVRKSMIQNKSVAPLLNQMLRNKNLEIKTICGYILSMQSVHMDFKDEVEQENGLDIVINVYSENDDQKLKYFLLGILASLAENPKNRREAREKNVLGIFLQDANKVYGNPELTYQYVITLIMFANDMENYRILCMLKFHEFINKMDLLEFENEQLVPHMIYLARFSESSTSLNIPLIFLNLVSPIFEVIKAKRTPEITRLAAETLSHLSIRYDVEVLLNDDKYFLKPLEEEIIFHISRLEEEIEYDAVMFLIRIYTNIFINMNNVVLAANRQYTKLVQKMKEWSADLRNWQKKIIQTEINITQAMYPTKYIKTEEISKINYGMSFLKDPNIHIVTKAVSIFAHMAMDDTKRDVMMEKNMVENLIYLVTRKEPTVVREAAAAIGNFTQAPHGLLLWFKFDTVRVSLDASNNNVLYFNGNPKIMPEDRGLYDSWGAIFDLEDYLEFPGEGIDLGDSFTVSFWSVYPLIQRPTYHTLLQSYDGQGGLLLVDLRMEKIGVYDSRTGKLVKFEFDLSYIRKGWHFFLFLFDLEKKEVKFFLDGDFKGPPIYLHFDSTIKYFGNNKDGNEPWGVITDFRIYNHFLSAKQIKALSILKEKSHLLPGFPDYSFEKFREANVISALLKGYEITFEETLTEICRSLANLSSKKSCKLEIIKLGGVEKSYKFTNSMNMKLKIQASRLLVNLS